MLVATVPTVFWLVHSVDTADFSCYIFCRFEEYAECGFLAAVHGQDVLNSWRRVIVPCMHACT